MDPTLRRLAHDDVERYRTLRLRALRDEPRAFSDAFEDERERSLDYFATAMGTSDEHVTVGAFAGGDELVATATFKRDQRTKARHKGYVHTMYVAPEVRRHGLGKRMLAFLVEHGRAHGLEQLHLWVLDPEHSAARRLYGRAGFVPQGLIVRADLVVNGSYVDAEYLTLALS